MSSAPPTPPTIPPIMAPLGLLLLLPVPPFAGGFEVCPPCATLVEGGVLLLPGELAKVDCAPPAELVKAVELTELRGVVGVVVTTTDELKDFAVVAVVKLERTLWIADESVLVAAGALLEGTAAAPVLTLEHKELNKLWTC
ncbi:uncharacterized protein B0I36DRAFT_434440 [Microdochium trichocladiopsis]|uniref:Secreted protein n=1 Tax=Microdochium trichocladiopsis TaxID=1682393 RepID=A0A9P8XX42_9PEZI|nr:uncharacterized protein B0I36DRAFT_434440 [Microdochium trichocladiopsis]KAH7024854.1 hypothetical protein B0I36DRAFT_434440 [Microdochium trichocladiopsis]